MSGNHTCEYHPMYLHRVLHASPTYVTNAGIHPQCSLYGIKYYVVNIFNFVNIGLYEIYIRANFPDLQYMNNINIHMSLLL